MLVDIQLCSIRKKTKIEIDRNRNKKRDKVPLIFINSKDYFKICFKRVWKKPALSVYISKMR